MKHLGKSFAILFSVIGLLFLNGCSEFQKPSSADVEKAIYNRLYAHYLNSGRVKAEDLKINLSSIEVLQWGNYNKENKYWPAIISYKAKVFYNKGLGPNNDSDTNRKYHFYKNDFGEWTCDRI